MSRLRAILIAVPVSLVILTIVTLCMVWQPFVYAARVTPPPVVSTQALERHVRALSQRMHPRHYDNKANLEAVASYIHETLAKTGAEVTDQWYAADSSRYRNIIARFGPPGANPVVVGAHYDACGPDSPEEEERGTGVTPGADDNASGIAGILELARLMQANPPRVPLLIVAYCLEEPPYYDTKSMGSVIHAKSLAQNTITPRATIVLEMIGYFADKPGSQSFPVPGMGLLYPDAGNFIGVVGRPQDMMLTRRVKAAMRGATTLPVYSINAPALVAGIDFSDHRSYWAEGMSAVMITDTAFYRNKNYHTPYDTAEKLDYGRMAKVVQGVFTAVMREE